MASNSTPAPGGNATATANASATGDGEASATAVATPGLTVGLGNYVAAKATSNAETAGGAKALALSTAEVGPAEFSFDSVSASSTANTSFAGVTTTATAISPSGDANFAATTEAIAQGGSNQTLTTQNVDFYAISTAHPDKAYVTALIGGASNVADALLGPGDELFGAAILDDGGTSTFDFSFRGDLILGDVSTNTVTNLGLMGPNINWTIEGDGVFVLGGAVPEPSTWAMVLLGFAGLGFAGYSRARRARGAFGLRA